MSPTVLIVEEYADLCSAISTALSRGAYDCESVTSAEDAIVKLQGQHYDLILLAPRIPIGTDPVMHFLHEEQPGEIRKVILMTEPDLDETDSGDCRTLHKPFNHEQLFAKVRGN